MTSIDRLPPHDLDAEKAALGCILIDWQTSMPVCIESIGSRVEIFYDLRHQQIYRILVEMYDAQEAIDMVTLNAWLGFQDLLEKVGGIDYLSMLPEAAPSAANLAYYLVILQEKLKARRLISLCSEQVANAYDNANTADELIAQAATGILSLADDATAKSEESSLHDLVPQAMDQIETWHSAHGVLTGISTGFSDLDRMTTGFQPGEMIVIAGRPSLGKTSLCMNIAEHVAAERGFPVGVFSLEMTKIQLAVRMICSRARVNVRKVQHGYLSHEDYPRLMNAGARLHSSTILINDQSGLSILGLRTRARRMAQQHGIRLLVIDYLQLMTAERNKNDSREQEVSAISKGVKGLAKELGIPVIAISQLNRGIEKDKERRPRMSDLRESGSLEQDADFVGILWRPQQDREDGNEDAIPVNLEICKQRNGPTGTVPLVFIRQFTRFESLTSATANEPGYNAPYADEEPAAAIQQQEMAV